MPEMTYSLAFFLWLSCKIMCDLEHEALLGEHPPAPCGNELR
jgi:hypothetical protein